MFDFGLRKPSKKGSTLMRKTAPLIYRNKFFPLPYCTQKDQNLYTILAFLSAIGLRVNPSEKSAKMKIAELLSLNVY